METATKKKRGRPEVLPKEIYSAVYPDKERRTVQNNYYAVAIILDLLKQKPGDFFVSPKGNLRRQGIAEKIGRLYAAGKLTEEQARELSEAAMQEYEEGATVKEVVKHITVFAETCL